MKILILLFFMVGMVFGSNEIVVTGKRVTAGCEKIMDQERFFYSQWAGPCPGRSGAEVKEFLYNYGIAERSLPDCTEPEDEELGEFIDGNITIPDGYDLVEENITYREEKYYKAYGKYSRDGAKNGAALTNTTPRIYKIGIRLNPVILGGYCGGIGTYFSFKADVYAGTIKREYFKRVYKKRCNEPDKPYPSGFIDNRLILFSWGEDTNESNRCIENDGLIESKIEDCEVEYRCIRKSIYVQIEIIVCTSSYVNPKDRSFKEDIALDGADFTLSYSSKFIELNSTNFSKIGMDFGFGKAWMLSNYAQLYKDGYHGFDGSNSREYNLIYFGDGRVWMVNQNELVNNKFILNGKEYQFNSDGGLESVKDIYSGIILWQFEHDSNGFLTKITDADGKISTINRVGSDIEIVAPYGQKTTLHLNSDKNLESVEYEDGSDYSFEYENNSSLLTKKIGLRGQESTHIFDKNGKIVKVIDVKGAVWSFDGNWTNKTVFKPIDSVEYKHYPLDENGVMKSKTILPTGDEVEKLLFVDENKSEINSCGVNNLYEYETDSFTNLKRVKKSITKLPSGLEKTVEYKKDYTFDGDTLNKITEEIVQNGKSSYITTNFLGKNITFETQLGRKTEINFDNNMKNILSIQPPFRNKIEYEYDGDGRVIKIKQGNRTVEYSYDSRGNIATTKDVLGNITSYSYDVRDRLISINYPDGNSLNFNYDKDGNIIALTTPTNMKHKFEFDELSLPNNYTSPMKNILNYEYDDQRRVIKITKPSGKSINIEYKDSRVDKIITDESSVDYQYFCQNLVSSIQKNGENLSFTYDGNLLKTIAQNGTLNQNININYNSDFLPISMNYAGKNFSFEYDGDNRVIKAGDFTINPTDTQTVISDGNYEKKNIFNLYGELTNIEDGILDVELNYNEIGKIVSKTETISGENVNYQYSYDKRGRLIKVIKNNQIVEEYTYDANGNRISAKIYGKNYRGVYNPDDQLVINYGSGNYLYDKDGYLIQKNSCDGTTEYTYDTFGELTSVTTPEHNIDYIYNGLQQRVAKIVDGEVTEKYLWLNLTTLLAIYDKNDNLVQRFEYANNRMPVAMTDANGTKYYLHYDQVGSLRAVSNENGDVVKEIVYDTFGNIISDSNETLKVPFGFAGGLQDRDTKLIHFGFREYDPFTGRWTAKDPILFAGGDSNLYGYVLGDPVGGVDPEGLSIYGKLWILTKNRWNHIYNRHINLYKFKNKSKWLFYKRKIVEEYIDITIKYPDISTSQENGKILYEKLFDKAIGTKGERWVRVILDKENKIVTAFPAKSCKPKIIDKPLESGIGPIDTIVSFIIGELFFSQD